MDIFSKIITKLYMNNQMFFVRTAKRVLSNFYYVPLEIEDLISNCLQELILIAKKSTGKSDKSLEGYVFSHVKFIMYSYCRKYTNKNNGILNNYVDFDSVQNFYLINDESINLNFDYLTNYQQNLILDLFKNKISLKNVAKKNNTTSFLINKELVKIRSLIKIKLDNSIF